MRRLLLSACAMLVTSAPAQAGQPIHTSMAECAGLSFAISDYIETRERRDFVIEVANIWADEAEKLSGEEMTDFINETADRWSEKGRFMFVQEEFKDWTSYCGALARHRKIEMPKRP
ncbi:MAG: hypothetical protein OXC60_13095 [Litoreibacter sp.]|nr:hypothetical protein [Litoreibacter sp.]